MTYKSNTSRSFSFTIATSVEEALALVDNWQSLILPSQVPEPSLQPYWVRTFLKYYGGSKNLAIALVEFESKPCLLAPLQIKSNTIVEFVCDETSDFNDFYFMSFPNGRALFALLAYLRSIGIKEFVFSDLPNNSRSISILTSIAPSLRLSSTVRICQYMPIVRPIPNLPLENWPGVNQNWLALFRERYENLTKRFKVELKIIDTSSELLKVLPIIMDLHVDTWYLRGAPSKFSDIRRRQFTTDVCREAFDRNNLFLALLTADDQIIAYRLGFRSEKTIYAWITSFSFAFRQWSPGHVLLMNILSRSKDLQFTKFNFLKGEEPHKYYWTNKKENTMTVNLRAD